MFVVEPIPPARECSLRSQISHFQDDIPRRWAKNEKMSHETVSGQSFSPVITVQLYLGTDTVQCTTGTSTGKTGAISRPASRHITRVARNSSVPGMLRTNQACSKACSSSAAALWCRIARVSEQRLRYKAVKVVLRSNNDDYVAQSVGPLAPNASAAGAASTSAVGGPRRTKQPGPGASRRTREPVPFAPISEVIVAFLHLRRKCDGENEPQPGFPIFPRPQFEGLDRAAIDSQITHATNV